jgi:hypothetical protein
MIQINCGEPAWGLSDYADVASVVIAVAAIWISVRATNWQKVHNEMSVAPLPYVFLGDYNNKIYVKLTNSGIGPLIVKSISVKNCEKTDNNLLSFMPNLPNGLFWTNYVMEFKDRPIPPRDDITLLQFDCDLENAPETEFRDQCRRILASLTVSCDYTDMYGKKFPTYSRKLTWFSRDNV